MQYQLEHNFRGALVIVDDKAELVHSTVELLRREYLAVPVIGYSDSREAAAFVARARPAVLICNHQMPPVGGVDLITMAQKRWGQLSTIALVSGAGLGPGGHVRASAHLICLEKPFSIATLCECIVELSGPRP